MPKISVVIPVYNAADFLPQTLESILNQSLKDIEVICVDDGSTDRSLEILQNFAARDARVRVLRQRNQHAGVARNAGMAVASGEYIHFMDADDYVLDYAYEALYNKAKKYDLDLLKFASVAYDVPRETAVDLPSFTLSRLRPGDFNRLLGLEEGSAIYKVNVSPWNGLYRRNFLEEKQIRFNDLYCVNDRSFFSAVITNAGRMMLARDRLVVHRVSLESSLVGLRAQHFECQFRSIELVEERLGRDGVELDVAMRMMKKEFDDLASWCRLYCDGSELGDQILAQTEQFVRDYSGRFAALLRVTIQQLRWELSRPRTEPEPPQEVAFRHEACPAPKVSVVLPIYNVEDYLNEALHSLSVQTMEEMEFLCVNDGSTDGCMAIMREYAAVDGRFRILDGPNGGYGKAMNRGIDAARGEYLGILEPDDFVEQNMFQELYKVAVKHDLDFVKSGFYPFTMNRDGSLREEHRRLTGQKEYYNRLIDPRDDLFVFQLIKNTWSGIYKLDFLNSNHIRHNETPGASYQDNGFWFQTFCCARRVWFLEKGFYHYRQDNPNSSIHNTEKVYCVTGEYAFIWNWLSQRPELAEIFAPAFYRAKYMSFQYTYNRVAREYQREYLHHMRDEFKGPLEEGLLDESLFNRYSWMQLQQIIEDPDAYYDKLRVSVIIPVYNASEHLRACMDSVLLPTSLNLEVICVDDGSTDDSLAILQEYAARDSRVRVITQPNGGAGAARNTGMQYATGEYLSFLDADDIFERDMLRKAYQRAVIDEADIVAFRSDLYDAQKDQYLSARYTIKENLLPVGQPFAGLDVPYNLFGVFMGWAWDKLFRREFIEQLGITFQEQRTTNDMLFVFAALAKAERIVTMNDVLAHHRMVSGSLSVTREKSWHCFYDALCALCAQLRAWGLYERLEQDFVNYAVHFTLWNINSLRGPSLFRLHEALVNGWAEDLGMTAHEETYFYSPEEYRQIQNLLSVTGEEYLFQQLDGSRAEAGRLRAENERQRRRIVTLERRNRRQKERLESVRGKNTTLREKNAALREKHKQVKNSSIWKVGRVVTWAPRKLKKLLKKGQ